MKVSGAELTEFMESGWPQPDDDWYWDHDLFHMPIADVVYDTDDIGPLLYQGRGADPTEGDGYDLATLIRRWRKQRDSDVLVVTIPRSKTKEAREFLRKLGASVK